MNEYGRGGLATFRLDGVHDGTWPALLDFLRDLRGTVRVILLEGDWRVSTSAPAPVEVLDRLAAGTTVSIARLRGAVAGAAADLALACTVRTAGSVVSLQPPVWSGLDLLRARLGVARTLTWSAGEHRLHGDDLIAAGLAEQGPAPALVDAFLAMPDHVLRETVALLRGSAVAPAVADALARMADDGEDAGNISA